MNIKYHLMITEPANCDLREIADYIANELLNPAAARNTVARIVEAILQLEQVPFRYGLVQDERLAGQGIKKILVNSYIVFYVVSEQERTVTIIRILYGKRHWSSLI